MLTGDPNLKDPSQYVNGFYYVCYLDEKRHHAIVRLILIVCGLSRQVPNR
jgi:hypothetical protein